jgi:hypothetical protein
MQNGIINGIIVDMLSYVKLVNYVLYSNIQQLFMFKDIFDIKTVSLEIQQSSTSGWK